MNLEQEGIPRLNYKQALPSQEESTIIQSVYLQSTYLNHTDHTTLRNKARISECLH